ncbi:MAG: PQQ-binding-like beta-propeller repeat protein [Planctomycetes bacterium]|nr:PQQ-binding-like beta-propeller repeat protein [Planctomycetota bacterium]
MNRTQQLCFTIAIVLSSTSYGQNWPQGSGPNGDFRASETQASIGWSVSLDKNIAWRTELPETGQSSLVIWGDRLFLTTMKSVTSDSKTGKAIAGWCLSAKDGSILWQREITGSYQTKLSAPFGDASSPSAVTDGKHVWFLSPTGQLACFDMHGAAVWSKQVTSVARAQPVLHDGMLIFHRQVYLPDADGHFTHENKDAPREKWTQLHAIDAATGDVRWVSECGVNMGAVPILQQLENGTDVFVVGRGGGHGPPEKPEGVSMIRADNGKTVWTLALPGFMSTQTFPIINGHALVFRKNDHLWVTVKTGKISRQVSLLNDVPVRRWTESGYETRTESLKEKSRPITQQSNLLVGKYHYFRSYTRNYLGRDNREAIQEQPQLYIVTSQSRSELARTRSDGGCTSDGQRLGTHRVSNRNLLRKSPLRSDSLRHRVCHRCQRGHLQ